MPPAATPAPVIPLFLASAQAGGAVNYPQQATSQSEVISVPAPSPPQQQEWDTLYAIGRYHFDVQSWQEALSCFRQLQASAGDYRDIATLITTCEARLAQPPPPNYATASSTSSARASPKSSFSSRFRHSATPDRLLAASF